MQRRRGPLLAGSGGSSLHQFFIMMGYKIGAGVGRSKKLVTIAQCFLRLRHPLTNWTVRVSEFESELLAWKAKVLTTRLHPHSGQQIMCARL